MWFEWTAVGFAVGLGLLWEFAFIPWKERRARRIAECRHEWYREGGPYDRTEKCKHCPSQRPITMLRCPHCRKWSDAE